MKYIKLADVTNVVTGGTPSTSKKEYWENGDIPWLQSGCCQNCDVNHTDKYITKLGYENSSAKMMPKNTVMIALTGATAGKIGYLNFEACGNQSITGILPTDNYNSHYLFYYLQKMRSKILTDCVGGAQPHISQGYVKEMLIPDISLDEQNEVVKILDKITKVIKARQEELFKLDELVKARFVEMFGNPIINEMGWKQVGLKEVSTLITNGNTPKGGNKNYVDEGIIFLRSQNVWRNKIILDDVVYIDMKTNETLKRSKVKYNDILITKTGRINTENSSLGRAALYLGEDYSANLNGHVYLVRLTEEVNPKFAVTILTSEEYREHIRKVCVGGIDKRQINLEHVEEFPMIVPSIDLQNEFADFVKQIDKLKVVVQKALEEAKILFDSLMQEYFG